MDANQTIGFQLAGVQTHQFAIVEPDFNTTTPLDVEYGFEIRKDNDQKIIAILFQTRFKYQEKNIIVLECSCHFKIMDDSWNRFKEPDSNALTVPKGFLTHLAIITVGTARGILHTKTEGTNFNGYMLPTLNVSDIFPDAVKIE